METLDTIQEDGKIDYFEFYKEHVEGLTKEGKVYKGWCPFHPDEGTERKGFVVNPENGLWHCYSLNCPTHPGWHNINEFRRRHPKLTEDETEDRIYGYAGGAYKVIPPNNKPYWEGEDARNKNPYNPEAIKLAKKDNKPLWICEGEKDTETMLAAGELAIGIPTATSYSVLDGLSFEGIPEVIIACDNDPAGRKATKEILKMFPLISYVEWPIYAYRKGFDVTDLKEKHTKFVKILLKKYVKSNRPQLTTLREIIKHPPPPIKYVLDGILPEGVTIFAGKAKKGKSIFLLNLCYAIAFGTTFLGRQPKRGSVFYIDLEETRATVLDRLGRMKKEKTKKGTLKSTNLFDKVRLATKDLGGYKRIGEGGLEFLRANLKEMPDCRAVIIDPWVYFKPLSTGKKVNDYDVEYENIRLIIQVSSEFNNLPIILVFHSPKMIREDPGDLIQGTVGNRAAPDGALVLYEKPQGTYRLNVDGRNVNKGDYVLKRGTKEERNWYLVGNAEDVKSSDQKQRLYDALTDEPQSVHEIANKTGLLTQYVRDYLPRLISEGDVERSARGLYKKSERIEEYEEYKDTKYE